MPANLPDESALPFLAGHRAARDLPVGPFFTLRGEAGYLNLDGTRVVANKQHAYRGTFEQARKMRKASQAANGMTITRF